MSFVATETDRGLFVGALVAAGYTVLAVNPMSTSRYRERHSTSGAKSDPGDAKVLAELARTDGHNHRPIAGDSDLAEAVKVLARAHQSLIWTRQRQVNQLRSTLRGYNPAALEAFPDLASGDARAVLAIAPTPALGRKMSQSKIASRTASVPGWPFWAATSDERIDRSFDLARLEPGEHLLDLGCGDGRVLLRAGALRAARVTGVELDPELAASARALLAEHEIDGLVIEGDFATAPLADVDVVFAYLSPATLQRLAPRLQDELRPRTRIVTTGYAVPGWEPVDVGGRCFLYRTPVAESPVDRSLRGWEGGGVLVAVRPASPSLVAVKVHHPGGRVAVRVAGGDPDSAPVLHLRAGADVAEPGDEVVVDLRFEPQPAGSVVAAALDAAGVGAPFQVLAVVDEGEPGVWGLSVEGCDVVGAALGRGEIASVLADARRSTAG